jgi:hypothetical protein
VVVQRDIAAQGLLPVLAGPEALRAHQVGDALIQALDHAVGLPMAGWREPVLNAQRLAQPIEVMLPAVTGSRSSYGSNRVRRRCRPPSLPGQGSACLAGCARCVLLVPHIGAPFPFEDRRLGHPMAARQHGHRRVTGRALRPHVRLAAGLFV